MKLFVNRLNEDAKIPSYGSIFAAGMDLYSSVEVDIPPQSRKLIATGISIKWESDKYYIRIAPRSGLSVKHNIDVGAGVIDFDYRGEIYVCFINQSLHENYKVKKGDKIAQMILTKIERPFIMETTQWNQDETERGNSGFGSTGC